MKLMKAWGRRLFGKSRSLGECLDAHGGFGPGFDFCRLYLALSVLVWHSWNLIVGESVLTFDPATRGLKIGGPEQAHGLWLAHETILPMFFALSGFLITGSALRLTVKNFLLNRALRIYPALGVEVLLSAFALGPVFTVLGLNAYFHGQETYTYLFNLIGYVHFKLPGVFEGMPVNASLWTVPVELACYIIMAGLIVMRGLKKPGWIICFAMLYPLIWEAYFTDFYMPYEKGVIRYFLDLFFNITAPSLIPCFLGGIAMYLLRYRIPHSKAFFAGSLLAMAIIALAGERQWVYDPVVNIIINPLMVYAVVYVGLCKIPKLPFYSTGDYSHGIYLYGYPIQQSLKHVFPHISLPVHQLASVILVTLFAAFSWHCIEKPILAKRKEFAFISRRREEKSES